MTPQEIQSWSAAAGALIPLAKEAIAAWPSDEKKEKALKLIADAEIDLAVKQGFEICHRHFPAGVMTMQAASWRCLECKKTFSEEEDATEIKVRTHGTSQSR